VRVLLHRALVRLSELLRQEKAPDYRNAGIPVSSWPIASVWMSCVPS